MDVRWQRNFAELIERFENIFCSGKTKPAMALLVYFEHGRANFGWLTEFRQNNFRARARAFGGAHQSPPVIR